MAGFSRALPILLEHEGGYVDHPDDPGGATNQGITQDTYDRWRKEHDMEPRPVEEIAADELEAIYREEYWLPAHCEEWPWPLSLVVFDAAVNHGPGQAIRLLQRAAGVRTDGIVGPKTRAAVKEADPQRLIRDLLGERLELYARIVERRPESAVFLVGWIRRVRSLQEAVA
jgi:lysozyme family protein